MASTDITCRELVELLTDYLEGAMEPAQRARVDRHLSDCGPCSDYLEQFRATIKAVGRLDEDHVSAEAKATLLDAFRGWKQDRTA